jgi:hypothetical protein
MGERRPMGPEGDRDGSRTPRMRDRRTMGPGPERTPQMGERRPMGPEGDRDGSRTPRMRDRRTMGPGPERTPQMGERILRSPSDPNSPNRRRPRPPPNGEVSSPSLSFRNSPRLNVVSPREISPKGMDLIGSPNSSLSRDPTGMNMHKPINTPMNMTSPMNVGSPMNMGSPFRHQHSMNNSPVSPMILPESRMTHGNAGINNIERKFSTSSARSLTDNMNGDYSHRRTNSVSSSISAHSTSSERPPKSIYRKSGLHSPNLRNNGLVETQKTPLVVNNIGELNAHSASIQSVNEFGEVEDVRSNGSRSGNQSKLGSPQSVDIDFNQLLNSLDNTLQDKSKNFTVRSNISSPANSRRNSELEKLRADTKSKFEDMEKLLDNTIKNKIKSRSNATSPVKVIKHQSKHFEDSHLKNLLEQLSMTSVTIEKEIKNEPLSPLPKNPDLNTPNNEDQPEAFEQTENTIKELQETLDGLAIQTKNVLF